MSTFNLFIELKSMMFLQQHFLMDLYFCSRAKTMSMLHTYLSLFCGHKTFKDKTIKIFKYISSNKLNVIWKKNDIFWLYWPKCLNWGYMTKMYIMFKSSLNQIRFIHFFCPWIYSLNGHSIHLVAKKKTYNIHKISFENVDFLKGYKN